MAEPRKGSTQLYGSLRTTRISTWDRLCPLYWALSSGPIGAAPEDEETGRDKLRRLLTTLRAAPSGRGVRIQWCGNIRANVATSMPFVDG